jgi:hypothetical protein
MMKKINKTVKEILDNPELRQKAEAFEDSDDEKQHSDDEEVDEEIEEQHHEAEAESDGGDEYGDDEDFKHDQVVEPNKGTIPVQKEKENLDKSLGVSCISP